MTPAVSGAAKVRPRRRRTDRFASGWLVAALVVLAISLVGRAALPQTLWTMVHVVTLGVLTNAILQWSWYFTRTLLRLPPDDRRAGRDAAVRVVTFNVALVGLFIAMWTARVALVVGLAALVGLVIAWHGLAMVRAGRTRLASRFAVVVRYYVAAAGFLVVGCVLASMVAFAMLAPAAPDWLVAARDDLTLAHSIANVGGWIGLSVAGTIMTLGPTMLRTRIDPQALARSTSALPWLAGGIALATVAAAFGRLPIVALGLLVFLAAMVPGIAVPLVRAAIAKGPGGFATWTMTAGLAWIVVALAVVVANALVAPDVGWMRSADLPWLAIGGIGGIGQVFVAALTYLLPVVVGGGPQALRAGMAVLERAWPLRVVVRNATLALLAATTVSDAAPRSWWWGLVLVTFAVDVALMALAGRRQARVRRAVHVPETGGNDD